MEEERNQTLQSKTGGLKRWGTLVLAIFLGIVILPYFTNYIGFCLKTMEFRKASDNISYWDVISWVKEQNNLNEIGNNESLIQPDVKDTTLDIGFKMEFFSVNTINNFLYAEQINQIQKVA